MFYFVKQSDPAKDVDFLTIRASAKEANKINVKMSFNMETPDIMLSGLQERIPAIASCFYSFAEKHQLLKHSAQLKNSIMYYTEEAHNIANNHAPHLSEVSILFKNTVAQLENTLFIDKAQSDAIAFYINAFYESYLNLMTTITKFANTALDNWSMNNTIHYILDVFRTVVNQYYFAVTDYLEQAPAQYSSYVRVEGRKLEIIIWLNLHN